jgi:uncharacterized membrane protein (DUF485 family)
VSEPRDPARRASEHADAYRSIHDTPEFAELRRRFRRLVFPLVAGFLAWYFVYVLLATYAHDLMATEVFGRVNVGLLLGLGQFVSTFGIAWWYAHRADRDLDPLAAELNARHAELTRRKAEEPAARGTRG